MRQGFLVNVLALCPELVHDLGDLEGIPVQDRIGNETQATGLVHDLLVIPRRKFALVGKENPARQLMAVFALVELELHGLPQVTIREIAQDVLRFNDPTQVGKGLR